MAPLINFETVCFDLGNTFKGDLNSKCFESLS